jgi:hypothetical protein
VSTYRHQCSARQCKRSGDKDTRQRRQLLRLDATQRRAMRLCRFGSRFGVCLFVWWMNGCSAWQCMIMMVSCSYFVIRGVREARDLLLSDCLGSESAAYRAFRRRGATSPLMPCAADRCCPAPSTRVSQVRGSVELVLVAALHYPSRCRMLLIPQPCTLTSRRLPLSGSRRSRVSSSSFLVPRRVVLVYLSCFVFASFADTRPRR